MNCPKRFVESNRFTNGVWYNVLDRVVFPNDVRECGFEVSQEHQDAYDEESSRFMEEYRRGQKNMTPDQRAELQADISANFEPGTEVVNLITGESFKA